METECDGCGETMTLTTVDSDGILIGDEHECGYYTTRYMPGQNPDEADVADIMALLQPVGTWAR